ncbi:MAG TPA: phosphoenolpyruvate--protein phosphotransferase [Planctomycetota bacterium]|nr:phosphoenolpyruvate--protein phosphotransferase [Planctomycetota bacterium]
MRDFKGIIVSEGAAAGEALVLIEGAVQIPEQRIKAGEREREISRYRRGVEAVKRGVEKLRAETEGKLGDLARVLDTYLSVLDDPTIGERVVEAIRGRNVGAAVAVQSVMRSVAQEFRSLGPPLASYAPELVDLERRIVDQILGREAVRLDKLPRPVVVIADELTPMQTVSMDRDRIMGIALDYGTPESHTAIVARHLGIPALIGLGDASKTVPQGARVIIDALEGRLVVEPDRETAAEYAKTIRRLTRARHLAAETVAPEPITRDETWAEVRCNIDTGGNARGAADLGVQGVGLFRTEFLFIGREEPPDEDAQVEEYVDVLRAFGERPVVFRTMDFGADKFDARVNAPKEPNPFLGLRGLRLTFELPDLLRTQLRAVLRASVEGSAQLMFPMVNDLGEFRRARAYVEQVKRELRAERIPFDATMPVGAMVETPAAALQADVLLREADFLSLGTNDLTQYCLAVDRTNAKVAPMFKPHHPAVCRLIQRTLQAGRAAGKSVSACGEMAGAAKYVALLLGLGLRIFSCAAPRVRDVIDRIRRVSIDECEELAARVLGAEDAQAAGKILDQFEERFSDRRRRR